LNTANQPPERFGCVVKAWHAHEAELTGYLVRQLGDASLAQDILQDVFLKSMRAGQGFCRLDNPRAWLYQVAKTTIIDHARAAKPQVDLPDDLAAPQDERAPVEALDTCVLHNLPQLAEADRDILAACDLHGQTVRDYANSQALSLPAAKSRLLRARQRLRQRLLDNCQVRFDANGLVCCHVPCTTTPVQSLAAPAQALE
jgi:RNA polymerase sigma-70 factor (ECF subfamily)